MPDEIVDDREPPPRLRPGGHRPRVLALSLESGFRRAVAPALLATSALLVAGQLFRTYRTVWPAATDAQFQAEPDVDQSTRVGLLLASPYSTPVSLLVAAVPLVVLAGLVALPLQTRPPVPDPLRRAGRVTALMIAAVGVLLAASTAVWAVVTRGEVTDRSNGSIYFTVDPLVTALSRGGDGLATAVLAGVAGWLLRTRWADATSAPSPVSGEDARERDREVSAVAAGPKTSSPSPPLEGAGSPQPADPAYRDRAARPGEPGAVRHPRRDRTRLAPHGSDRLPATLGAHRACLGAGTGRLCRSGSRRPLPAATPLTVGGSARLSIGPALRRSPRRRS